MDIPEAVFSMAGDIEVRDPETGETVTVQRALLVRFETSDDIRAALADKQVRFRFGTDPAA